MNKEPSRIGVAASEVMRAAGPSLWRGPRLGLTAALGASLVLCGPDVPRAQQRHKEPQVTVTGVSAGGDKVSISATGSLNRAQTWQDSEGFHVVLPNGQTALGGAARGVKVRRVGDSLELVVPVKPGASVTVHPRGERLDLVFSGGGPGAFAPEPGGESPARAAARPSAREAASQAGPRPAAPAARRQNLDATAENETSRQRPERPRPGEPAAADATALAGGAPKSAAVPAEQPVAAGAGGDAPPSADVVAAGSVVLTPARPSNVPPASAQLQSGTSLGSIIFSLPSLLTVFGLSLAGALLAFFRHRRNRGGGDRQARGGSAKEVGPTAGEGAATSFDRTKGDRRKSSIVVPFERRRSVEIAEDQTLRELKSPDGSAKSGEPSGPALPAVNFGAYRVDLEVALLVAGRPYSAEVIASRAPEDRRALATSLQKALRAPETDADGRRRTRMALEDYGFVARECAALLLGAESFERASAANALGEMRSAQALPFLTEALYDSDAVVRMAAVNSLGALGLPSAIGALLDAARHHPEIPSSVIGPALTACSVESLELAWGASVESRAFAGEEREEEEFTSDARMIVPVSGYEELPDWLEDESLAAALAGAASADAGARAHAAQALAQFQVRRAVEALTGLAMRDAEAAVRATAVTSLGLINHESVFAPVVVAMADEAREVRAAAARALSRLSLDRADAYVRVIETADARLLGEVARACVAAGLAGQAINRLASDDRRQGYEAFSLLSLVVKAGEVQPLLEAIEGHRELNVRLACVGLLSQEREPGLAERLRVISENGGVPERVRVALREVVERAGQMQSV